METRFAHVPPRTIVPRITGVGAYAPSRIVTNDEVLARMEAESAPYLSPEDRTTLLTAARDKLEKCGARERRWCAADEWCTDIAARASVAALEDAGVRAEDVDLILWASMARAFVEPATGHVLKAELGATRANVLDAGDACTGVVKALEVAGALIETGRYRTILIATGERTWDWADFQCKTVDELTWKFGALTVGDAAGALVVQGTDDPAFTADPRHWRSFFELQPDTYSTCNVGLNHRFGERYRLNSHSTRLFYQGRDAFATLFSKLLEDPLWRRVPCENFFLHEVGNAITGTAFKVIAEVGWELPGATYRSFFPQHGNVATASLPLALWYARQEGRIARGNRVLFYCPAAGVQAALMYFRY